MGRRLVDSWWTSYRSCCKCSQCRCTIVAPGLQAGQVFHEFRITYTTITAEKPKVAYQSIVQGKDSVTRFYSNLRRMVKLAYPTLPAINQEELVRQQFLQGLS